MKSRWLAWLLLSITLYGCYHYTRSFKETNGYLQQSNAELSELVTLKNQTLLDLQRRNHDQQQALIDQKNAIHETEQLIRKYSRHVEKLKNENEQLRIWFDSSLPDDVKRLLERPEITGSSDYRTWLSSRDALLSAVKYAQQQPVVTH